MQPKSYEFDSGHDKVYAIQYYVVKLISYLRQVGGFFQVHWFPPPKKNMTAKIQLKYS